MATKAVRHLQTKPRDIVVLLVAADHVKFGMGAPARLERLMQAVRCCVVCFWDRGLDECAT